MFVRRRPKHSSRSGRIATVAAVAFAASGVSFIGVSIASQERAPQVSAWSSGSGSAPAIMEVSNLLPDMSPKEETGLAVQGPILPRSKPVTLDIPSIGVHSDVQYLGQTADGALETPAPGPRYNDAAWYRYSPTPGSLGPAVLLGHVDSAAEGPSVFFRLGELQPGDRISVTRADESIATFVVDEVHSYAKDDFPTERVYSDIDHAGLRVVTCGGAFDDATGHYLENIVVFASLTDSGAEDSHHSSGGY